MDWNTPDAVERNKRDVVLKQIEIRALSAFVRDGMRVLDVGCGDGETLEQLAHDCAIEAYGLEKSYAMFQIARTVGRSGRLRIGSSVSVVQGDIERMAEYPVALRQVGLFDLVYTERALINLPTWELQSAAIRDCCGLLKPGGTFMACEHSLEGLHQTNEWRRTLGLSEIAEPEWNRYLHDDEVSALDVPGCSSTHAFDFAGLYFFLSRIIHASLAADAHMEPQYDAPINKLALELPLGQGPQGFTGYSKLWAWVKQ